MTNPLTLQERVRRALRGRDKSERSRLMRRRYQLSKWLRSAETVHRKAHELMEDIRAADGEDAELTVSAHDVHCSAHQLCSQIEGEQEERARAD